MVFATGLQQMIRQVAVNPWFLCLDELVGQFGVWCLETDSGGHTRFGDWYYPPGDTPDGFTLVPTSDPNNTVPYQSLRCANHTGLVVDGDVTNYQGIVKYSPTTSDLKPVYFFMYSKNVFFQYGE